MSKKSPTQKPEINNRKRTGKMHPNQEWNAQCRMPPKAEQWRGTRGSGRASAGSGAAGASRARPGKRENDPYPEPQSFCEAGKERHAADIPTAGFPWTLRVLRRSRRPVRPLRPGFPQEHAVFRISRAVCARLNLAQGATAMLYSQSTAGMIRRHSRPHPPSPRRTALARPAPPCHVTAKAPQAGQGRRVARCSEGPEGRAHRPGDGPCARGRAAGSCRRTTWRRERYGGLS